MFTPFTMKLCESPEERWHLNCLCQDSTAARAESVQKKKKKKKNDNEQINERLKIRHFLALSHLLGHGNS